jgi:sugar lactone lactonase YvrE
MSLIVQQNIKIKGVKMKKFTLILFVILIVLVSVSCSKNSPTTPADKTIPPLAQCYQTTVPILSGTCDDPSGIAVNSSGNVILSDGCVGLFDYTPSNGTYTHWTCPQYSIIYGVTVDNGGNIYVADKNLDQVYKYSSSGIWVGTPWGGTGSAGGQFSGPTGIVTDNTYVYVADSNNNRIEKFTMSGSYVSTFASGYYIGSYPFNPCYITLDGNGYLYMATNSSGTIAKFLVSDGSFTKSFGAYYSSGYASTQVRGLAMDKNGNLLVSTPDSVCTLQSLSADGALIKHWALNTCNSFSGMESNIATDNVNGKIYYTTDCGSTILITGYTQQ